MALPNVKSVPIRRPSRPSRAISMAISNVVGVSKRQAFGRLRFLYAVTLTLTCRGLASSRNGRRTVRTPCLYSASTLWGSTVWGSEKERLKLP